MNQIVHIFRKDCRRLWPSIATVLVFTSLHGYGAATITPGMVGISRFSAYALLMILVGLSGLLLPVVLFLLVVSVIQEESLVGSDKFWITRPYNRRSLALEKLLFVLLWAFLQMLLHDVIIIRHFGFSLFSASGLLLWKSSQFAFFLLFAAALAVLTASFARAVMGAIAALFAAVLVSFLVQNVGDPSMVQTTATQLILVLLGLAALGAVCVIAFQYRFRITPVAVAIGVAAILACALVARFWPSSLTAYFSKRFASPLVTAVQLLPDTDLTDLIRPPTFENEDAQAHTVYYPFRAVGLVNDVAVVVNGAYAEFSPSGQPQTLVYSPQQVRFQPANASGLFADAGGPDQLVPFAVGRFGDNKPLTDTEGTLTGKLYLEGYRSSVAIAPVPLPYQPQLFAIAGRRCSVEGGQRERALILRLDCVELEPGNTSRIQVHLLQDNHEIIPQGTQGQSSGQGGWPSFLSPIVRSGFSYQFSPQASAEFLTADPPRGRNMLVFAEESLGRQERPFRIEHFRPAELDLQAWKQRGALKAAK